MKRSLVTGLILAGVTWLGLAEARSQVPSIASAWGEMSLSLDRCLSRGQATFNNLGFKRIEAIGYTVYGDFRNFQFGIRCIPDKQIFYVFGGGPGSDDKPLTRQIDEIKAEFMR
jgi:hypothetical protein